MYGRAGILAHPYMLGPDGQSNGCVSVQDYPKFLEAFLRGDIDRLIVLPLLVRLLLVLQVTNNTPRGKRGRC